MIFWLWTFQLRCVEIRKDSMSLISIWYHLLSPFHIKIGRKNDSDFVHLFLKLRPNFRDFTPLKFNFQFLVFDFLILISYCPNFLNSAENSKPKFTLRMQTQFRMINCGKKQPCGQCKKYQKDFAMIAVHTGISCQNFFHSTIIPPWKVSWVSREAEKLKEL